MSDLEISSGSESYEISSGDEEPPPKKKYKLYILDPKIPIPESTKRRHKKKKEAESTEEESEGDEENQCMMQNVRERKEDSENEKDEESKGDEESEGDEENYCRMQNVGESNGDGDGKKDEDGQGIEYEETDENNTEGEDGEETEDDETDEDNAEGGDERGNSDEEKEDDENEESEADEWDANIEDERGDVNAREMSGDDDAWTSDFLYENSPVTVLEAVYKLMHGYIRYRWSQSSLKYNLSMIRDFLPQDNEMPQNLSELFRYVNAYSNFPDNFVVRHFYCRTCKTSLVENVCETCKEQNIGFFFDFDICQQIRNLFEKHQMEDYIRPYTNEDRTIIEDITDGKEYHRVNGGEERKDRGDFDLTLILNTDGLSLIKSNKSYTWPILLSIAELPPTLRERDLLFGGLWHDKELEPPMDLFLKPVVEQAKKGFDIGIKWTNKKGEKITTKFVVPLLVADAPARAKVLKMLSYNGETGCNLCEIKMIKIKINGKNYRIYPYNKDGDKMRTHKRILAQGERAEKKKKKRGCTGIKGKSVLADLPMADMGTISVPEYMHSMLLGLGKLMNEIWFEEKGAWSQVQGRLNEINQLLLNIHPPNFFNRFPRNLDRSKHYKASEFLNWILFYSLPCLNGFLEEKYLDHWKLFSNSLFYLLGDVIEKSKLPEIEADLKLFVEQFGELYGEQHYTYNVHQTLHLVEIVKRWGPLHATSAFPFEGFNQVIANCVHGTKNLGVEVSNKVVLMQRVNELYWRINKRNYTEPQRKNPFDVIEKKTVTINSDYIKNLDLDENIKFYRKMQIGKKIFTSLQTPKALNNSYTVMLEQGNSKAYGEIYIFFIEENKLRFVLKRFRINREHLISKNHLSIQETDELQLFKFEDVSMLQHVVRVGSYVIPMPFTYKTVL